MSKFMTYDYWVENFHPIYSNPDNDTMQWETYGDEVQYVIQQDDHNVWTEVDGDEGTYIVNGYHLVNRIHYYITEKSWEGDYIEIPTWINRDCDCVNYIGQADMYCEDCNGLGCRDIPVDTIKDLQAIYGEDAEIIG